MHSKKICLKHRIGDCKCNSPLSVVIGYRTRIPPKNKVKKWKTFVNNYLSDYVFKEFTREQVIKSWK